MAQPRAFVGCSLVFKFCETVPAEPWHIDMVLKIRFQNRPSCQKLDGSSLKAVHCATAFVSKFLKALLHVFPVHFDRSRIFGLDYKTLGDFMHVETCNLVCEEPFRNKTHTQDSTVCNLSGKQSSHSFHNPALSNTPPPAHLFAPVSQGRAKPELSHPPS